MSRWWRALMAAAALTLTGCTRLTIPSVGIDTAVVMGGQREIDLGEVVDMPDLPGIWIAAHRTTHGGPFHALPGIRVGDDVYVFGQHWRVASVLTVPQSWTPHYLGPLVLQTSVPGGAMLAVCERVP